MKKKTYTPPMTEAVEMEPCLLMAGSEETVTPTPGGGEPSDAPDFEGPC